MQRPERGTASCSLGTGRRRRPRSGEHKIKKKFVAALPISVIVSLGLAHIISALQHGANAFVIPGNSRAVRGTGSGFVGPRVQMLRHTLETTEETNTSRRRRGRLASGGAGDRRPAGQLSMVLSESPSVACRRALQRAWQASSPPRDEDDAEHSPQMLESTGKLDLRLTTFNLLAPCYKRMHKETLPPSMAEFVGTGLLAGQAKGSRRTSRESEFADVWRERALETVDFIRREMSSSDIICLQEFWFDPAYEAIFRSTLGEDYNFHTVQRTGSKADGVAVLLRRGKWEVRSSMGLSLSPVGDRVALVMHLRSVQHSEVINGEQADTPSSLRSTAGAASGAAHGGVYEGEDMILVNTHLAFPHHALDRANQMSQIRSVTEAVEGLVRDAGLPTVTPRVVVGDLNVEGSDPVCRHLSSRGFRSAFASLHREQRVITHLNHRGEELMVDHVFVKAPGFAGRKRGAVEPAPPEVPGIVARMHEDLSVEEAMLLPGGVETDVWSSRFGLSDHRPLTVRLRFPSD